MTPAVGPGLALGLASALLWGVSNVFAAFLRGRIDRWSQLGVWQAIGLPIVVLVALTTAEIRLADPLTTIAGLGAGLLATVAYASLFAALQLGPIAVVSPVVAANAGLGALLAVVVLHEPLNAVQAVGAGLATLGVMLVGVRFDSDLRRMQFVGAGVLFAFISMVAFALQTIVLQPVSREMGWQMSFVLSRTATIASVGAVLLIRLGHQKRAGADSGTGGDSERASRMAASPGPRIRDLPARLRITLLLGGIASVGAFMCFALGLERSYAWVIGVTSTIAPVVVLTAAILMGERLRPVQWAGVAIVLASVVLVSLG